MILLFIVGLVVSLIGIYKIVRIDASTSIIGQVVSYLIFTFGLALFIYSAAIICPV